ncbi:MAG TPA: hypothetical protein VHP36_05450 [Chitinispirillaceae bacterium]|nr:hypothetical protein [Chitinispirillaceae bacterium]
MMMLKKSGPVRTYINKPKISVNLNIVKSVDKIYSSRLKDVLGITGFNSFIPIFNLADTIPDSCIHFYSSIVQLKSWANLKTN